MGQTKKYIIWPLLSLSLSLIESDSDNTKKICYNRDQCNFLDIESNICYTECPNGSGQKNYHEYDSNICISNCASSSKNYLYHKENDKICYPSCSAIPGNYIYEIIDTTDVKKKLIK